MIKVKFIVLFLNIVSCACFTKYCKISPDHVLCKYPVSGPSISCREYDGSTFLTDGDINDLVNRINERRNFISMGHFRRLPGAANMNKIVWSTELATFAQRWADQCDPFLRPDKEDQCRDLEHLKVGQNIASITNPSQEFNVKSFVEMWFMESLNFKGSVSLYDQFQDHSSKHFTQLIWAETTTIGCGRAKFKINNIIVDRLVCNFAPKGNFHGKPIYAIGYPATQCQNQMVPDEKFKGLCTYRTPLRAKLRSTNLPVSSLLRILNLSNDSVKQQEIDPIYNINKQSNRNTNEKEISKHPIMRHVHQNQATSRTPFRGHQSAKFWERPLNKSRHEKEHSRLYHTHGYNDQPNKYDQVDSRDYNLMATLSDFYIEHDYRKQNFNKQCTRSTENHNKNCEHSSTTPDNEFNHKCTRGQKLKNRRPVIQAVNTNTIKHTYQPKLCPCTTCQPINTQTKYDLTCDCTNTGGVTIQCPNLFRRIEHYTGTQKLADLHGNADKILYKDAYPNLDEDKDWRLKGRRYNHYSKRNGFFQNNRKRKKRGLREMTTVKPFWQIENFNNDNKPILKSLRYTTLVDKRRPKTRKYTTKSVSTESITIRNSIPKLVTERYLSFDELLHLRKFNLSTQSVGRRMEHPVLRNEETTTIASDTEYTMNTPFIRMKHCTRRLTCTWTGSSLTDSNGSIIPGGPGAQGKKTPPGYVEGCTRTSTCTRDYMERNKFPTLPTPNSTNEDDDYSDEYCERRSLNIKKRNSLKKKRSLAKSYHKILSKTKNENNLKSMETSDNKLDLKIRSVNDISPFDPRNRSRRKNNYVTSNISYGDLFLLVLRKILNKNENIGHKQPFSQCHCNRASRNKKGKTTFILNVSLLFVFRKLILS